jgi:high-affinity K+ transport system ATPase subunit B
MALPAPALTGCAAAVIRRPIPISVADPGTGHTLAQTASIEKIFFQPAELLVDQVIGLVDEAERDVGHNF